ncbi:peptide chain release factor N(5)-glutamine methyltransferase [Planctomycetota bacterium]|nr:peptide chain release factor N(5)-glutamine methyltransferase [Planctomycetota bacterium]
MITIRAWLADATDKLKAAGVDSPHLTANLLLGHALGKSRADLILAQDEPLSASTLKPISISLQRRCQREPLEYITGSHEFFGRKFAVGPGVLIPRPETEDMVLWLKARKSASDSFTCCDIGTGSGCLGLTIAAEFPNAEVTSTDLFDMPLRIAQRNAETLGIAGRVNIRQADILDGVDTTFDIIVSNPPYVPEADRTTLEPEVLDYEPHEALFAGKDGTEIIRRMLPQILDHLNAGGQFVLEHDLQQAKALREYAHKCGFEDVATHNDFTGRERFLTGRKRG